MAPSPVLAYIPPLELFLIPIFFVLAAMAVIYLFQPNNAPQAWPPRIHRPMTILTGIVSAIAAVLAALSFIDWILP
jgi:hypothetical protein